MSNIKKARLMGARSMNMGRAIPSAVQTLGADRGPRVKKRRDLIKVKKMSKIKRWLRNWILDDENQIESLPYATESDEPNYEDHTTLRFNVTSARGGIILTVRNYDKRTDNHYYTAHVLHDDQNIADSIAQIVSMELLRSGS